MTFADASGQGWKRTAAALVANPFERFELPDGAFGWVYRYHNAQPLPIPALTTASLEVAVQLAGDWTLAVHGAAPSRRGAGEAFVVPALTRHRYAFAGVGRQVGFALPPRREGRRLLLGPLGARWQRRLVALGHEVAGGGRAGVAEALEELVRDRGALAGEDPVERARALLEQTYDRPLYLEHVAAEVGLHAKALSRRFVAQVGVAPIRFRTELRLQHAIRLLWSRPERPIARVAEEVGLADPRQLHRLTVATCGMTPAQLGRRGRQGSSGTGLPS
ncbi:MAG: AraC family transcriptional regulator [Myxococcota bacterium]